MYLSEIVSIHAGYPFRGKILEYLGSGVHVVQMKDISAGNVPIHWDNLLETKLPGKKRHHWIAQGDILFLAKGPNNDSVLVDNDVLKKVVGAPYLYILRVKLRSILPEFLVWQLNQQPLQHYFNKSAEGSVTKSVRRAILEEANIIIPSIEKQEGIIKLYRFVQQERKVYRQLISNLNELIHTVATDLLNEEKNDDTDKTRGY